MLLEMVSGKRLSSVRADDIPTIVKTLTNATIKRTFVRFTPKTKMVLTNGRSNAISAAFLIVNHGIEQQKD